MSHIVYVLMADANGTTAKVPAVSVERKKARGFTVVGSQDSPAVGSERTKSLSAQAEADPVDANIQDDDADNGASEVEEF